MKIKQLVTVEVPDFIQPGEGDVGRLADRLFEQAMVWRRKISGSNDPLDACVTVQTFTEKGVPDK